jgi:hypothetical protein
MLQGLPGTACASVKALLTMNSLRRFCLALQVKRAFDRRSREQS